MVCGYFDGFHAGHIRFFERAFEYGDVIVGIGNDTRMRQVKKVKPICSQDERLYMVRACRYVAEAFILEETDGVGGVVWEKELARVRPDVFIVNNDISQEWLRIQEAVCRRYGVEYVVLDRDSPEGLSPRSSTSIRGSVYAVPHRAVLTTGADQTELSSMCEGACIGFSVEPDDDFHDRAGMLSSMRHEFRRAFGDNGPPEYLTELELAKIAFSIENVPTTRVPAAESFPFGSAAPVYIGGSVDHISAFQVGITKMVYDGNPWPKEIDNIRDPESLDWLEQYVTLEFSQPRLLGIHFHLDKSPAKVKAFMESTFAIWDAVYWRDYNRLVETVNQTRDCWVKVCTKVPENGIAETEAKLRADGVDATIAQGAGCGGYILAIAKDPKDRIKLRLRRP
jgi:cytidyltransferase-like protein